MGGRSRCALRQETLLRAERAAAPGGSGPPRRAAVDHPTCENPAKNLNLENVTASVCAHSFCLSQKQQSVALYVCTSAEKED